MATAKQVSKPVEHPTRSTENKPSHPMADTYQFEEVGEPEISFWDFKKDPELVCTNYEETDLSYKCFLVEECTTGEKYYVPAHKKIVELFESGKPSDVYKIYFKGERPFDKDKNGEARKTYNSYDTQISRQGGKKG
jgi:hypothetical protein